MNLHASICFGTQIETHTHNDPPTYPKSQLRLTNAHQNREARHRFALLKVANCVTRQSAALLHTIIPKTVLARLATLQSGECLNTEISQGTIMFCKLITPGGGGGCGDGDGEDWEGEGGTEEEEGWKGVEEGGWGVNREGFERVSRLVAELDDLVVAHAMTKYQHINQWYIVVCPAIVEPFAGVGSRPPKGPQSAEDEVC